MPVRRESGAGESMPSFRLLLTPVVDGRYLASGSEDKNVIEWDVREKNIKTDPLRGYTDSVLSVSP